MRRRRGRGWRVLAGMVAMLAFVAVSLAVVVRYAGDWGVPYFSFSSANGSRCTNDLTGYTCTPLTLADVEFFGDVNLPRDTTVVSSRYRSTHDYALEATVAVPPERAAAALRALHASFGKCQPRGTSPLPTTGLRSVCVMVNPEGVEADGELSSRLYSVGTGLRRDGSRVIALSVRSR